MFYSFRALLFSLLVNLLQSHNTVLCMMDHSIGLVFKFLIDIIMFVLGVLLEFLDISKCLLMIHQLFLSNLFNVLHGLFDNFFFFIFGGFVECLLDSITLFLRFSFRDFLHVRFDALGGFCLFSCNSNLECGSSCSFYRFFGGVV